MTSRNGSLRLAWMTSSGNTDELISKGAGYFPAPLDMNHSIVFSNTSRKLYSGS